MVPSLLRITRVSPWNRQHADEALARFPLGAGGVIGSAFWISVPVNCGELPQPPGHPHRPSVTALRVDGLASTSIRSPAAVPKIGFPQTSSGSAVWSGPLTWSPTPVPGLRENETSVQGGAEVNDVQ